MVVIVLGVVWLAVLCWLAVTSANAVLLNAAAAVQCDSVATVDVESGVVVRVARVWRGESPSVPFKLSGEGRFDDGPYVVLLNRVEDQWVVIRSRQTSEALVYSASADVDQQLERLTLDR